MAHSSPQQSSDITSSSSETINNGRPPLALSDDYVIDDIGKLSLADSNAVYTGSSHWVTILEDVSSFYEKPVPSNLTGFCF